MDDRPLHHQALEAMQKTIDAKDAEIARLREELRRFAMAEMARINQETGQYTADRSGQLPD